MMWVDTHTHFYLKEFDEDRDQSLQRAISKGIDYLLLPNIDSLSTEAMLKVCEAYPTHCFPMMGLHPTSVKENYKQELEHVEQWVNKHNFIAIGEVGIDLYWDKTYHKQQEEAFRFQIELAKKHHLPLVIHSRNSMDNLLEIIKEYDSLTGVFHCFSGNSQQALEVIERGFYIGVGGVVTYKNSVLTNVVKDVPLSSIVLETDAPYLAPVPYRGKRNESEHIVEIAKQIAFLKNKSLDEIAQTTTNAITLFNLKHEK